MKEDRLLQLIGRMADRLSDGQVIAITMVAMVLGVIGNLILRA